MALTRRQLGHRGISFVETCVTFTLLATLAVTFSQGDRQAISRARDAALRQRVSDLNAAVAGYRLEHGGRPPTRLDALRRHIVGPIDSLFTWRGSADSGRFAMSASGRIELLDSSGAPSRARDAWGRSYETYH